MTAIRFTLADLERANAAWGCNCGPAALAAIAGLTLDEVRRHFPSFRGWTSVPMMLAAVDRVCTNRRSWTPTRDGHGIDWPRYGLALVQFEGPWMAPHPTRERWLKIERAKHTHWVGARTRTGNVVTVWDINAMTEDGLGDGWLIGADWERHIVPALTASHKRATGGWHITHAIEVER